jgi:hypothetical protein
VSGILRGPTASGFLLLVNRFLNGQLGAGEFELSFATADRRDLAPMHRLAFFAAFALVLASPQTMACQNARCATVDNPAPAECNAIGCVRATNSLENLAKTAERTLSVVRATEPGTALGLCGTGNCVTEPTATPLPQGCSSAGCATPEPKARPAPAPTAKSDGASTDASAVATDAFAAAAERPMRLPPAVPWAEWAERWALGGLYRPPTAH